MSRTRIPYADETLNLTAGCAHAGSPGCDHCYALRHARRMAGNPNKTLRTRYQGLTEKTSQGRLRWTGEVRLLEDLAERKFARLRKVQKPLRIFVGDMADLFHTAVPGGFLYQVLAWIAACPQHTFLLLTKRAARMADLLCIPGIHAADAEHHIPFPIPNVWLGVTIETAEPLRPRAQALRRLAARGWRTWVSYEPALGPLSERDLTLLLKRNVWTEPWAVRLIGERTRIAQWVVMGYESGPHARPGHPDWARRVRDRCREAGVPFFFKQWGPWRRAAGRSEAIICTCGWHVVFDPPAQRDAALHRLRVHREACARAAHGLLAIDRHRPKPKAPPLLDGEPWQELPARR